MKSVERNEETSTAKAHFYEEPLEFPASNFKVTHFATLFLVFIVYFIFNQAIFLVIFQDKCDLDNNIEGIGIEKSHLVIDGNYKEYKLQPYTIRNVVPNYLRNPLPRLDSCRQILS